MSPREKVPVSAFDGDRELRFVTVLSRSGTYDVASDGRRFLVIKEPDGANAQLAQIIVVRNWSEELKRLVPVGR